MYLQRCSLQGRRRVNSFLEMMIPLYDVKGKIFAEQKLSWWQFPLKLLLNFYMEKLCVEKHFWKCLFLKQRFTELRFSNTNFRLNCGTLWNVCVRALASSRVGGVGCLAFLSARKF